MLSHTFTRRHLCHSSTVSSMTLCLKRSSAASVHRRHEPAGPAAAFLSYYWSQSRWDLCCWVVSLCLMRSVSRNSALLEDKELTTDLTHDRPSQKQLMVVCVIVLHCSSDNNQVCAVAHEFSGCDQWPVHLTRWQLPFFLRCFMFLCVMCNTSLPRTQKTAVITPVLKKQNADPGEPKNCRPFSNLTFISQVLERTVVWSRSLSTLKKPTWCRNISQPTASTVVPSLHSWRFCQTFSTRLTVVSWHSWPLWTWYCRPRRTSVASSDVSRY